MWYSFGLKYSVEDLEIAGNIPVFNFACVTPPFDSIKFGALVSPWAAKKAKEFPKTLLR